MAVKTSIDSLLFDSHLHVLSLGNVCLSAYLSFIDTNKLEESLAVFATHDYILQEITTNGPGAVADVLAAVEHSPVNALKLLEDDLAGLFEQQNGLAPLFTAEGIRFAGKTYQKLVIMPLIMDFDLQEVRLGGYYRRPPSHPVTKQAVELLDGIRSYRRERPDGRLIVRPYMGLNPAAWSLQKIETMLKTYFNHWTAEGKQILPVWEKTARLKVRADKPYPKAFAGIKLYPPLGFDPWPDAAREREKVELVYSFCEKRGIPIISHCDDQGFRVLPMEESFKYTEPDRWRPVLKKYPSLYLDIAHFGKQYYRGIRFRKTPVWQKEIVPLLLEYPHVYTDMSFNGVDKNVWKGLGEVTAPYAANERETIYSKIMFGTDWPLCLFKIKSALQYWRYFTDSPLSDELKTRFARDNPRRFHFR